MCRLSFYKEELAGETKNYVHLRATAERCTVEDVLRELMEEVAESAIRMKALTDNDKELSELWERYFQVSVSSMLFGDCTANCIF